MKQVCPPHDSPAGTCTLTPLLATSSLKVSEFLCPGTPLVTGLEAAPDPEIVLVRRGAYIRRDAAGAVYVDRTVVAFFEAERPYVIEHPQPRSDATTVISLLRPGAVCDSLGAGIRDGQCFTKSALRATPDLQLLHRRLHSELKAGPDHVLAAEETAIVLITEAVRLNRGESTDLAVRAESRNRRREVEVAVAIAEYLNAHYRERIDLEDIARFTGYSVFHLCRMFNAYMKSPIHRYLVSVRLQAAMEMLADTDLPVTAVALEVGYGSHSHFTSAFTRWSGLSPSNARKLGRRELVTLA